MNAVSKMSPVLPPMFSAGSDDHVTCKICLVRFSYPARLPLSLHCLHTYCSQCVISWTCNKTKQKLSCPMCSKITKIDKGKKVQECLPINHAVLELSSMLHSSNEEYRNDHVGQVQRMRETSQAFIHADPMPMLNPQPNVCNTAYDHKASSGQLSSQVDDRVQHAIPSKLFQMSTARDRGNLGDLKIGLNCADSLTKDRKIYPDLSKSHLSSSDALSSHAAAQYKTKSSDAADCCDLNKYDSDIKTSACCSSNNQCQQQTGKVQPILSINIGDIRFHKPDGKDLIEIESYERRQNSPSRITNEKKPGAVTELSVNNSPRIAKRLPDVQITSCIAKISSDMCIKCSISPAVITVTNSKEKSVHRLCSDCYSAEKDKKFDDEKDEQDCKHRPKQVLADPGNNQARTVVKVQSKLGEAARSSPVWETRTKQSFADSEKKVDTSNMSSVLRLGDSLKSATPHISCSNQVGLVCGPFKSEHKSKSGENEDEMRDRENNGAIASCGKPDITVRGQAAEREINMNKNRYSGAANKTTTVDIGTMDQTKLMKKTATTTTDTITISTRSHNTQPTTEPKPVGQNSEFRPHEYVVAPTMATCQNLANKTEGVNGRNPGVTTNAAVAMQELNRPDAYNPQYNEFAEFDTQSLSDLGLPTVDPVNIFQRTSTKHQEATEYNSNQSAHNQGMYPTLSSPPTYEEIMAESKLNGIPPGGGEYIPRFGKYGESSSQPGVLRSPARMSVSRDDRVAIVDTMNKTIQVFQGQTGDCLSLIRVEGATGCCLVRDGSLVVATNKGVEVYKANGILNKKVDMGSVVTVVAYRNGFVAAQTRALVTFRELGGGTSKTLTEMRKSSQTKSFQNITDVAVNNQQDFLVLDSGTVYILSDDGFVKGALRPHQQPCGPLTRPTSIDVDDNNNVLISDAGSGRILLFNANGHFLKDILEPIARGGILGGYPGHSTIIPTTMGVGRNGKVYIALKGDRRAEIIVVSYL